VDQPLTVQRESYRLAVRALSMGASLLPRLGLPYGKLDEASLLAGARRMTGLEDWGGEHFVEPLRRLLHEVEQSGFTGLARFSAREVLVKHLSNRLCLTEHLRQHPALNQLPIDRPVFILGFPRTGTTALQSLLCQIPGYRALPFWEIVTPVPMAEDPEADRRMRIKDAQRKLDVAYFVVPELAKLHEIGAETYEECWPLLANSFSVPNWEMTQRLPEYGRWLREQDMVPVYREYKQCLQVMGDRTQGTRFVLKCPDHLSSLDALLEVFPDACIVWTHRDPVDCIASYCSMVSLNWRLLYGRYDPEELGPFVSERFLAWVQRAMDVRARVGDDRFVDVDLQQVNVDPAGVVGRIVSGFELPEVPLAQVEQTVGTPRADDPGQHVYSVARYGIDSAWVHDAFGDYIQRFSIPMRRPEEKTWT